MRIIKTISVAVLAAMILANCGSTKTATSNAAQGLTIITATDNVVAKKGEMSEAAIQSWPHTNVFVIRSGSSCYVHRTPTPWSGCSRPFSARPTWSLAVRPIPKRRSHWCINYRVCPHSTWLTRAAMANWQIFYARPSICSV